MKLLTGFKISGLLLSLVVLSSCVPLAENQDPLLFSLEKSPIPTVRPVEETKVDYEFIKANLIDKSCMGCHKAGQEDKPSFASKAEVIEHAEDIILFIEQGCALGKCMPPLKRDGTPSKPIPTKEIVDAFKKWRDNDFP